MNITSTAVTTTANETTEQGYYELVYSVQVGAVERVQATLFSLPKDSSPEREHLGYIIMEGGTMHCSLPDNLSYAPIFTDFDSFIATIKQSLTTSKK